MSEEKNQEQKIETISFQELFNRVTSKEECLDISVKLLEMAVQFANKAKRLELNEDFFSKKQSSTQETHQVAPAT